MKSSTVSNFDKVQRQVKPVGLKKLSCLVLKGVHLQKVIKIRIAIININVGGHS